MFSAAKLKEHYAFTDEDARRLARLRDFMEPAKERVAGEFYRFIVATPEVSTSSRGSPSARAATAWRSPGGSRSCSAASTTTATS